MAHTTLPALALPEFPQLFDGLMAQVFRVVDACHDPACPIVGSHNTDECAALIAEMQEGSR